ncbi:MAG: hypothetical protein PHP45_05950 [Elusimicrobiales bacterium]|nr:hypothetical protein [Elusimicrobiales bacterium]
METKENPNQTASRGGTAGNVAPTAGPAGVFESLEQIEKSLAGPLPPVEGGGAQQAVAGEPAGILPAACDPEFVALALREIYGSAAIALQNEALRLPEPQLQILGRSLSNYMRFKRIKMDSEKLAFLQLAIVGLIINAPIIRALREKPAVEKNEPETKP